MCAKSLESCLTLCDPMDCTLPGSSLPGSLGCMRQVLRPGALGKPRANGWRGSWEGGLGWGTHVNPWLFHFNV